MQFGGGDDAAPDNDGAADESMTGDVPAPDMDGADDEDPDASHQVDVSEVAAA
jgi:hypothetical protein